MTADKEGTMPQIIRTITFVRHGQSEQNLIKPDKHPVTPEQLRLFRERETGDHRLTKQGVAEARRLGEMLRSLKLTFDLLVTSSYVRAQETLLEAGLEGSIEVSPLLDERYSGEHEPLRHSEALERFPSADRDRRRKETRWRPENGESMRDVLTRTLLFMGQLHELEGGNGNVLIVSHSRVIASYMWWAEQLEDGQVPGAADGSGGGIVVANGEVTQYGWAKNSLRPTHKRSFLSGQLQSLDWQPLPTSPRFSPADLRRMVEAYPRIL